MDNRAIGVMDSGLGGVTVLKRAAERLPDESFVFYGDSAFAPYGDKRTQEIHDRAMACAEALIQRDVKAIVIACNTATSAAIEDMRSQFSLPVISMEPAIKPALAAGPGRILMLATRATCNLSRYQALKRRLGGEQRIVDVPCTDLVAAIESHLFEPGALDETIAKLLSPFDGQTIAAIVLGCTHFTLAQADLARYADAHFRGAHLFFEGSAGTVAQIARVLEESGLHAEPGNRRQIELRTSGDETKTLPLMRRILAGNTR